MDGAPIETLVGRARRLAWTSVLLSVLAPLGWGVFLVLFVLLLAMATLTDLVVGGESLGQPTTPAGWVVAGVLTGLAVVPQLVGLAMGSSARRAGSRLLGTLGMLLNGSVGLVLVGLTAQSLLGAA